MQRPIYYAVYLLLLVLASCSEQRPLLNINNGNSPAGQVAARIDARLAAGDPNAVFDPGRMAAANFSYGGLLYDKWWTASFQNPLPPQPADDAVHPLYPTTINPMLGSDTFRCKECHGWDYLGIEGAYADTAASHYTGIAGVVNLGNNYRYTTDSEIWTFLHDGDAVNGLSEHAFGNELSDDDVYNLTRFILNVREEAASQQGPANFIDASKKVSGDSLLGSRLFQTNSAQGGAGCADFRCHGPSGRFIPLAEPLGQLAQENPWEVLHKIRFGQPGSMMVGLVALNSPSIGIKEAADVLSFVKQALGANYVRGGRLFDNWPVETGMPVINSPNPLWGLADPLLTGGVVPSGAAAWRCVACHDFHYEGNIAFYYNNLVYLKNVRQWSLEYVYLQLRFGFPALMPDGSVQTVHNFSPHMLDTDLWELAAFAIEGIRDTSRYLQPDLGTAVGDASRQANAANGLAIYDGSSGASFNGTAFDCISCHDPLNGTVPDIDIAAISWNTPWQFFHRVRFGMPRAPDTPADVPVMPGLLEVIAPDGINTMGTHDAVDVQRHLQESLLTP